MSVKYTPVGWNRNKLVYDLVLIVAVGLYIYVFLRLAPRLADLTRPLDGAMLRAEAFGTCAFLMLTLILCIGPLARLDRRFLPLLYNRRHFGVMTCAIAFVHASHVLGWYFSLSPTDPYVALLGANTSFGRVAGFPFELFGIAALAILLVLAVTSHDFWLAFLTPPVWKAVHMLVYAAYAAVVLHVALGALQSDTNPALTAVVTAGTVAVCGFHLAAGLRERAADLGPAGGVGEDCWLVAARAADISDGRAVVVPVPGGERVAIFRDGARLGAVSNVCAHQNGPLGEGRLIDGCVTCPWHGFQYRLADGCAPPPYTEKIATYRLKLEAGLVLLDPRPNRPGTRVDPIHAPRDRA
jgi:nitrite reductase/ring-hydroxylating ferredoxin subunit/DMSO/TMAO reductase YedYZ heme-binding membrane subunit